MTTHNPSLLAGPIPTSHHSYAENNAPGTVAADFLELLMFGVPSPQLENFLQKVSGVSVHIRHTGSVNAEVG